MVDTTEIKRVFAKNLKKYMHQYNIDQQRISEIAGVSRQSVSTWLTGKNIPRMGVVEKLAAYFGILKSDLLEDKDKIENISKMNTFCMNDKEAKLLTLFRNFPEEKQDVIVAFIKQFSEKGD